MLCLLTNRHNPCFRLVAAVLMMVNNTENDAANVKVFGAFIIIMDFIAAALSTVYGVAVLPWAFCCQDGKIN